MANTPKAKNGRGSSKPKSTTSKNKSARLVDPDEPTPLATTSETGCCCCNGKPSFSIPYCEDDECNYRSPPSQFGAFVFDPNQSPQSGPYWEKPANFPVAELRDMLTVMIANMTPTQISTLAGIMANAMAVSITCNCGETPCNCTGTIYPL